MSDKWTCLNCGAINNTENLYCPLCLVGRPMERKEAEQIFKGLTFHFNGIIPRTLKHPSHSVEWRMAERHGAVCTNNFDTNVINILIYRRGYERSEKVKECVEKHFDKIMTVPIEWMLDSLLQSRQIHPGIYKLKAIPPEALPTTSGNILPHYQHPFYSINAEEYSLFPLPKVNQDVTKHLLNDKNLKIDMPPKILELPPFQWERVSIWSAAAKAVGPKTISEENGQFESKSHVSSPGIEFHKNSINKINPFLFKGIIFALSESLRINPEVLAVLRNFGGRVVLELPSPSESLHSSITKAGITHVLFHHDDKKKEFMIYATASSKTSPVKFCEALWAEDCLLLDELVPAVGNYVASSKLMLTLEKKRSKR